MKRLVPLIAAAAIAAAAQAQAPFPGLVHPLLAPRAAAALKAKALAAGLSVAQTVSTAWASATAP